MIDNLRISLTDQCNLQCVYCAPLRRKKQGVSCSQMTAVDWEQSVKAFVRLGIKKIKLTGGEPLIYQDLEEVITRIKRIAGVQEISLTTNGVLLDRRAKSLKAAGLDRINISMDSLSKESFQRITRRDVYSQVYQGFFQALESGFSLIKLNVIPLKFFNENELTDFVSLSMKHNFIVRFIELFSTNESSDNCSHLRITTEEVKKKLIRKFGQLYSLEKNSVRGDGPAVYYRIGNTEAKVGFISNYSENFCDDCTRLRMDSRGNILPCLFASPICNVKKLLKQGQSFEQLLEPLAEVMDKKILFNKRTNCQQKVEMCRIGG